MQNKLWESTQVCPCLPLPTCARACPSALLLLKLSPLCLAHAGPTIGECNVCPRRGRRAQHHRRHRWQRRPTLVLITLCACACERVYICMVSQFHERARRGGPDLRSLYSYTSPLTHKLLCYVMFSFLLKMSPRSETPKKDILTFSAQRHNITQNNTA